MVKIRLRRVGAKKQPYYRVVVSDSRSPRDGKFIETIGNYNPRTDPPTVEIDAERALYWLSVGAQPSAAVERMLDKMGILSQVAAVRRGEVSVQGLASQIESAIAETRAAKEKAMPEPIAEEEKPEGEADWVEVGEGEADWLEGEEEEEEEEIDWGEIEEDEADWDESEEEEGDESIEADDEDFDEPEVEQDDDLDDDEFTEDDE
jgi:small subunit ribosomal protein S16